MTDTAARFDRSGAPLTLGGRSTFKARVARVGAHDYGAGERGPGSERGVERRDARELRRIVEQLPGKPLTLPHPRGLIASGAQANVVGSVLRAWVEGDYAWAEFRVDSAAALAKIGDHTARELSLGYAVDMEGEWQRNTRVDHLALVPAARCGSACSIRTDCGPTPCSCNARSATRGENVLTSGARRDMLAEQARAMSMFNRTLVKR